ncbi:DUF2167 domain-containing protein [Photobacterium sp. R1]
MNIKHFVVPLFLLFSMTSFAKDTAELTEEEYVQWAQETWDSLKPQKGDIPLSAAKATLHIPEGFYYLSPGDSETVLVDVWGNPPGQNTLGMIFPGDMTPFDPNAWAVTISYEEDGYVSDEDAHKIDYDDMLDQMKSDTAAASKERVKQGYEAIELVGWAASPFYDASAHKLHWAKEIKFGNEDVNTLNYNIRVLGRQGVLVMNFIAAMDQKLVIESKLDDVLALAEFDNGAKYGDFDASIDKVAAYGLGALIAGKVAAKTGLIAAALLLFKKFWIVILAAGGALIRKVFQRKSS